ncbi:5339_t:CDS:1, partial [Dentiscutata erythropus]
NNIQRKKVEIEFKEEIEMLYDNFENRKAIPNNDSFSNYQINENSVKTIVLNSLKSAIGDSFSQITDYEISFYALGLDSLSATKLRGILQNQFSDIKLPHNIVFEYNTVQSLTNYLKNELSKNCVSQNNNKEKLQELKTEVNLYIQKYSKTDSFPSVGYFNWLDYFAHVARLVNYSYCFNGIDEVINEKDEIINGETVLITGVTGSLGSFILRDLLKNPNVRKVYCLVRASDENHGWCRLEDSFKQRQLDTSLLFKENLIILPCDLGDSKFGLSENIYSKLVHEVTKIYHVAWRLDFNNKIEVFERECIGGTVHLLMLAREAYAYHQNIHFNFISSISTAIRSKTNVKEDELPGDISNSMLNGYGLSKFITEH